MTLKTQGLQSLEQVRAFLEGAQPLGFAAPSREAAYEWIATELRRFAYPRLGRPTRACCGAIWVRSPASHGLRSPGSSPSSARRGATATPDASATTAARRKPFARRYTPGDVRLLAEIDALHITLSELATRNLCERAYRVFSQSRECLAVIFG